MFWFMRNRLSGSYLFLMETRREWLRARAASTEVTHLVHAPSNPPGWSVGKWGDWYPDVLGADKKLTTKVAKPTGNPAGCAA